MLSAPYYADEKFDIIWANEFISHVHPVEDFFEAARKNLKQRKYIVICDSNDMNPYAKFNAWKAHRKGGLYTSVIDSDSLEPVPYARERLLSILKCKELMEQHGFETYSFHSWGYAPRFPCFHKIAKSLEDVLNKVPIIRLLGVTYVVIGKKVNKKSKNKPSCG
jgi:SAM-dependent methyltransferase